MAENVLPVRMQLRYDTYSNWMNSETILLPGEIAIAAMYSSNTLLPSNNMPENTPPAVGIKVGDGTSYFYQLPWLQAVSADVYNWAKTATKPTYTANEIGGLAEYIASHGGGGSGGSGASSGYQIIYDPINKKYILQYYDDETDAWIDTNSEIEMGNILNRLTALENWANGDQVNIGNLDFPLIAFVYEQVVNYLNRLDVNDQAIPHQFVTQVEQVDGKIYVTRNVINVNDLSGVMDTAHGGTGLSRVEFNELLAGSMNGEITTKTIATSINDSEEGDIPTTNAVVNYVSQATAGLTGAMHFVGEATVAITIDPPSHVDPQITGYNFRQAQLGDVILANNKQEFVWTGVIWRLLGDEGSYAIKGSIMNIDISDDAAISPSKIDGLNDLLSTKVDKVEGKVLSSNDYTDEEKQKLNDIEYNAQENIIEHIFLNNEEAIPGVVEGLPKSINLLFNGMTPEQGEKLDGIEENAQRNIIEHISLNNEPVPVNSETHTVNLQISEFDEESQQKLDGIESGAEVNIINNIYYNGTQLTPDENRSVFIVPDPHTEHENVIEEIFINNIKQEPINKQVKIVLDQTALDLDVLAGATIPDGHGERVEVTQVDKKLELEAIAVSGNVKDLRQTADTFIRLDCGTSNRDTHQT